MKTPISAHRRGIALVIVLSLLVLITVLVVGFLVRVGSERTASANYYATATTRQLADTAVNLVQAQINEATTNGSGTNAWVSQPGALRVFDNTGNLAKIYRLYSAPSMVTAGADPTVLKNDVPVGNDWTKNPAVWVDLNAPVTISGGTSASDQYLVFPILDPRDPANPGTVAAPKVSGTMAGFSLTGSAPGATTAQPVPMPVQWLYVLQNGQIVAPSGSGSTTVTIAGASKTNPVVGRIAFWTDDECAKVNINTAAGSLSVRPDPSSSGSANAVLPAPWETPRFNNWDETRLFSQNQPVHGEYQRYPGHPATTDLYGILNSLGVSIANYPIAAGAKYSATASMAKPTSGTTSLSPLMPRYGEAWSSMAGTAFSAGMAGDTGNGATPVSVPSNRLYTSLGEMYFSSGSNSRVANGLTRQQLESGKFFLTAHSRAPEANLFGMPRISMWPIDSAYAVNPVLSNSTPLASTFDRMISFCTTTGTGAYRHPYYIQRHDAYSATADANIQRNTELYAYLQRMAARPIPGFGGIFEDKYTDGESDQILTEMVDYVRSTNVFDHSTASGTVGFTKKYSATFNGYGHVVPLQIGDTQGLGRAFTISEVGLHVICTADGNSPYTYKEPANSGGTSTVLGGANDYRYISNLTKDQFLSATNGDVWGLNPMGVTYTGTGPYPAGSERNSQKGGTQPFPANPTLGGVALTAGQKRLQAMLVMELQSPMQGYDLLYPNISLKVSGLSGVSIGGVYPFPSARCDGTLGNPAFRTNSWTNYGGYQQFSILLTRSASEGGSNLRSSGYSNVLKRQPPDALTMGSPSNNYSYVSDPFTVSDDDKGTASMNITGGTVKIEIQVTPQTGGTPVTVQTFSVNFPTATTPVPDLMQYGLKTIVSTSSNTYTSAWDWWGFDNRIAWATNYINRNSRLDRGCIFRIDPANTSATSTSGSWTFMTASDLPLVPYKDPSGNAPAASYPSDVVRSLIAPAGDVRLVMAKKTVNANGVTDMLPTAGYYESGVKLAHNFVFDGAYYVPGCDQAGKLVPNVTYTARFAPKVPSNVKPQANWDWDTGQISSIDGAYSNKPDEGNLYVNGGNNPYFQTGNNISNQAALSSYFTANRIIPSPVMFGSLPTGVKHNVPWRTLVFRPAATSDSTTYVHDTLGGPPDHLLLDWFTMPVVEPYAISEPFSTAGKINMNYQIVPFTYINRSVGLRAVLGSELMARVPKASGTMGYKSGNTAANVVTAGGVTIARLPMNLDEDTGTLRQFKDKFNSWQVFKSPSEICDIYLVPKPYTWPGFDTKWYGDDFALVGDNVRERPYADIYPRLTTKSNTYTVHFRVQALKNPPTNKPDTWNESTGTIVGEYRGATTIERYLDPSNKDIPDYATTAGAATLDSFYQWRTVSNTAFAP